MPMRWSSISILIVSWNGRPLLESCLASLLPQLRSSTIPTELWIWDNGSTDGTASWLAKEVPEARVIHCPTNVGFAPAVNGLAERASGDALILLNNDATVGSDWLGSFVEASNRAPKDVIGLSGRILNRSGTRLDFGQGLLTFDGHAFQLDFGRSLREARLPEPGAEVLFACGGNCILERKSFLELGGFDADYFAYLEDVDFGYRTWAQGKRLVAAPAEAVAYHRSMATSDRLGSFRRGFLFERNALSTVFKNFDRTSRQELLPAVLWTYLSRLEALLATEVPAGILVRTPPIGGPPVKAPAELSFLTRLTRRFREEGWSGCLRAFCRRLAGFSTRQWPQAVALGPQGLAHCQALAAVLASFDRLEQLRRLQDQRRARSDREIFARFPLGIVPTYPGDERLFASTAFEALLPTDFQFMRCRLEEVMVWPPQPPD